MKHGSGEIQLTTCDLPPDESGLPWGHVRSYSNQLRKVDGGVTSCDFGNGVNWLPRQAAYLADVHGDGSRLLVVISPQANFAFDLIDGRYLGANGVLQTLEHDPCAQVYRFVQTDGVVWEFFDFEQTAYPAGLMSRSGWRDQSLTFLYPDAMSPVEEVRRSFTDLEGNSQVEALSYAYLKPPNENAGNIESVVLRRMVKESDWVVLRRVRFTYYHASSLHGAAGDLELAIHELPNEAGEWVSFDTQYYRYYRDASSGTGFEHGLKFVLHSAAVRRLAALTANPFLAADTAVAQCADFYFEYDDQQRVVLQRALNGVRTIRYSYSTSANPNGFNRWRMRTVETRPDGDELIVYSNFLSQVMLAEWRRNGRSRIEYTQYDERTGAAVLRASPTAVRGYDDTAADLGGPGTVLHTGACLVRLFK